MASAVMCAWCGFSGAEPRIAVGHTHAFMSHGASKSLLLIQLPKRFVCLVYLMLFVHLYLQQKVCLVTVAVGSVVSPSDRM